MAILKSKKKSQATNKRKQQAPKKGRKMSVKKQVKFFTNIQALAKANMTQKEVAQRLVEFGSKEQKAIGESVLYELPRGGTFAKGCESWISPMAWEALLAGEKIGNWSKGIENALKILETSGSLGAALVFKFLKPIGMLTGGLGGLAGAYLAFFPKIEDIYPMARWGSITKNSYYVGEWVLANWITLIALFVGIIALVIALISLSTGAVRDKLDKFPVFRHYRLILSANLMRSLGNLTLAGFGLKESLVSTRQTSNRYQASHLDRAIATIGRGSKNVGDILDTGLLDPSEQSTLKVLGEKGGYSQTLLDCADITQNKVKESLDTLIYITTNGVMFVAAMFIFLLMAGVGILMFDLSTSM